MADHFKRIGDYISVIDNRNTDGSISKLTAAMMKFRGIKTVRHCASNIMEKTIHMTSIFPTW